jgi:hypothetical protein
MQRYTVYFIWKLLYMFWGGTFTHHQECIQLYLQHLVFVTPLLLPAAIMEEYTAHSNQFQLFHDSGR